MKHIKLNFFISALFLLILLPILLCACHYDTQEDSKQSAETTPFESSEVQSSETVAGTVINEGDSSHTHLLEKTVIPSTCTVKGYTLSSCDCGFTVKSDITPLAAHTLAKKTVDPTCTEYGGVLEYCTACSFSKPLDNSIEPYEHNLKITKVEASCELPESTTISCLRCTYSKTTVTAPALGHDYIPPESIAIPSAKNQTVTLTNTCRCGGTTSTVLKYSDTYSGAYVENTEVLAKGLDVSFWQFYKDTDNNYIDLDWKAIKASGIDYVILRAGSGNGGAPNYTKDGAFELAYRGAKAAGLDVGCYFYSYATSVEEIAGEAEFLLTLIEGKQFEYPVYLDLEDINSQGSLSNTVRTQMVIEFISKIQENGYYGALYVGQYWLNNYLETEKILSLFDVWMAKYKTDEIWNEDVWSESYTYNGTGAYGMWQFTASANILENDVSISSVKISGNAVDKNYCYKDYPTLIKSLGLNGFEKTNNE